MKKEPSLTQQQVEALYQEGEYYYKRQDYKKAVECYLQAAEAGHAEAQYSLGFCYRHGYGVSQDFQKAREWFEKAAAQGHEKARNQLAEIGGR